MFQSCVSLCGCVFLNFEGKDFFNLIFVCVGEAKALLQALVWAWTCVACKCAYACVKVINAHAFVLLRFLK